MKQRLVMDIECYRNYFLVMFRSIEKGTVRHYERYNEHALDTDEIRRILRQYTIVTFNGNNYDMPMLSLALTGANCSVLKEASDSIILKDMRGWQFEQAHGVRLPVGTDHIDLIEPAFGQGSLKLYGGRLHSRRLQDLPIEPDALISTAQRQQLITYCANDLQTTIDLYNHMRPQIELREHMTTEYDVDLRSKSDAQIAEAVIKSQLTKMLGTTPQKPNIPRGTVLRYKAPEFLKFKSQVLQAKLRDIVASDFVIDENGSPIEPLSLSGQTVTIGKGLYRMGIGGLHSSEVSTGHHADEQYMLVDRDVASYYPNIILICRLFPKHLTEAFLSVYRSIVETRLKAKRDGNSVVANALKIVANGSFGKLGSKYSLLYAPDLMIQVTVTGQLALLMLIESLEADGIEVVSANTDGIVIKCLRSRENDLLAHVTAWEKATGFETEETQYKALYSRDVNNYIALKKKGGYKGKGAFAPTSISKNPQNTICVEAVCAWLEHGTPLAKTIRECDDVRKFVAVRTVRGGAIKITHTNYNESLTPGQKRGVLLANGWMQLAPGPLATAKFDTIPDGCGYDLETAYRVFCGDDRWNYLGKVIRWYYQINETGAIHYKNVNKTGGRNKVPSSDGACPLMELPDQLPCDIDYERYIREANDILRDIGAIPA